VDRHDVVRVAAASAGLEYVDLTDFSVDMNAAALVPADFVRRASVLPLRIEDGELVVAVAVRQAGNIELKDDLSRMANRRVRFAVANRNDIDIKLNQVYRAEGELTDLSHDLTPDEEAVGDLSALTEVSDEAPVVRFVNLLISQAISDRASDIHIEPTERDVRIRYRVDGVLHEVMRSPKNVQAGLISRLKVMADINIAERRIPQDGRISLTVGGKGVDLRVATLPTVYGEKVVIRVLDKSSVLLKLEDLGFLEEAYKSFEVAFHKPYGAILVTGPTGSGKSTTLYATLNQINSPDRNIITVEDPVEYRLAGINQVQVNNRAGLTFASALRSILRADPDVVLIGEIRDRETAIIAIEASLTGHLVLSTLHTNDAASSLPRLVEMGVEPYLAASAIDCVVAQRLLRKLCVKCKEPYKPDKTELQEVGFPEFILDEIHELMRPVGCSACAKTGFRGRLGIYEIMPISEEIERMVVERDSSENIKRSALGDGMILLREDGLEKVRTGVTSIQEVLRVVA
jgi:type IV pilus assembly protein PilB